MKVKIEVSAKHIHFKQDDFERIFGSSSLSKLKDLSQNGEFAAKETVLIRGPKNFYPEVRILGPFRDRTQLELSKTDAIHLGIDAPLCSSGDPEGAIVEITGPAGSLSLPAAMTIKRHLHISSMDASNSDLKDGESISIAVLGDRSLVFNNVIVRISDSSEPILHLDTDEANAAGIDGSSQGEIIS